MSELEASSSNVGEVSNAERFGRQSQTAVIKYALIVNLMMFSLECYYGFVSSSTSLLADSFDMLGDASVYALTLLAFMQADKFKIIAAKVKAYLMGSFGLFIYCYALFKIFNPIVPDYETVSVLGALALVVNLSCFYLLAKYRNEDINMRSVWLCSRNDVIANIMVILSAILIWLTSNQWPDIVIGILIGTLLLHTSFDIMRQANADSASQIAT